MAEQPHAQLYRGLPPVVRSWRWLWLIVGAVFVVVAVVAAAVVQVHYSSSAPSSLGAWHRGPGTLVLFDRYSLIWIGVAFIVGGVLGVAFVRGWWTMVAVDVVGLAISLALMLAAFSTFYRGIYGWFFLVFGVSAGTSLRGRIHLPRGRTSALSHSA